ncbi:MAG: hypothetical protein ACOX9E_11395 [Lentisphaeria bacterium]|jgi:cell division septum initiation protein DivIVA
MKINAVSLKICIAVCVFGCLLPSVSAQEANASIAMKDLRVLLKDGDTPPHLVREWLAIASQEDRDKFQALIRDNPEEARTFLKQKLDECREERHTAQKAIIQAAQAVRQCKNDAEKPALQAKLRELLAEDFQRKSDDIAARIRMQEQNLEQARQEYQRRVDNAEQMINERMERMLAPRAGDAGKAARKDFKGPNKGQNRGAAKGQRRGGKQQKAANNAPAVPDADDELLDEE